jgi:hypothetical protein
MMIEDTSNLRKTIVKGGYTSLTILNQTKVMLHMIIAPAALKYTPALDFFIPDRLFEEAKM